MSTLRPPRAPALTGRASGFTMLEFLVTLAILALLAGMAVPGMSDFIRNGRVRGASFELRAIFVRARSEAINRNTEVELAPAGGDWRNGWTLRTAAGTTIENRGDLGDVVVAPAIAPTVRYGVDGRLRTGQQTIVISTADGSRVQPRCVRLSSSGRTRVLLDTDHDPTNGCS